MLIEIKQGFKVLENGPAGALLSSVMYGHSDASVEYKQGFWSVPNPGCGPLCVFSNIKDAVEYVGFAHNPIARVEYEEDFKGTGEIWWSVNGLKKKASEIRPRGTVLATRVRLLEEMTDADIVKEQKRT